MCETTEDLLNKTFGPNLEISQQIWAVREYIKATRAFLPHIKDQTKLRSERTISNMLSQLDKVDAEANTLFRQVEELIENVIPRYFSYPHIISIWALYEASVEKLADEIAKNEKHTLKLKDIKGDFCVASEKYFSYVKIHLYPADTATKQAIGNLKKIRNCIAHDNGHLSVDEARKLDINGVKVEEEILIVDDLFIDVSINAVENILNQLINYFREKYNWV